MKPPLQGRTAFVAGGSRGIGAAIVRRLADDGAAVAFTYSASADKAAALAAGINENGGNALAIQADSADPQAVSAAVDRAHDTFGRTDILVNNAGILLPGKLDDVLLGDFDRMVAINVRAAFFAAQAAARHMNEGGRIIFIGSVVAERNGFPGSSLYSMTKAAIAGMTRGLARDLGSRGITVNTVQPGPTATDMTPGEGAVADKVKPLIALGRLGTGEEVSSLVAYLAGSQSSFVTGASLTIDGGYLA